MCGGGERNPFPRARPTSPIVFRVDMYLAVVAIALLLVPIGEARVGPRFFMASPSRFSLWNECKRDIVVSEKHGQAQWFFERLESHRWRVETPEDADLVVVPALLDWYSRGKCGERGYAAHVANLSDTVLATSGAASRTATHLLIASDWSSASWTNKPVPAGLRIGRNIAKAIRDTLAQRGIRTVVGTYLNVWKRGSWAPKSCHFGVGFLANLDHTLMGLAKDTPGAEETAKKRAGCSHFHRTRLAPDVTRARPYTIEFMGQLNNKKKDRGVDQPGYPDRWALFHSEHTSPNGSSLIFTNSPQAESEVPQCASIKGKELADFGTQLHYCTTNEISRACGQEIRALTTFSLYLAGDDPGGDRLFNALAALQIPIMVGSDEEGGRSWLPFPAVVDWANITLSVFFVFFSVARAAFRENPAAAIAQAVAEGDGQMEDIRRRIVAYLPDFMWHVLGSRVHENILVEAAACGKRCARGDG